MQLPLHQNAPNRGFSFINCRRNAELMSMGIMPPKPMKTGTSIAGLIFNDGVILGADTRATEGQMVAHKNCSKIHHLSENIYCCASGTAADTLFLMRSTAADLELHRLNTARQIRTECASLMLKQRLYSMKQIMSVGLILGGVDKTGKFIYALHAQGSTDKVPFSSMGSGCLAAMSVLEAHWKEGLSEPEGVKLIRAAISAGVYNDSLSGSNIDICIVYRNSVRTMRTSDMVIRKPEIKLNYNVKLGTTPVLSTLIHDFDISEQVFDISD